MRALTIAAGLTLAATAAVAGSQHDVVSRAASSNITLANGCVYAPAAQANSWSLIYKQSGATANCAVMVRSRVQQPAATQAQVAYRPEGAALASDYIVGAFR